MPPGSGIFGLTLRRWVVSATTSEGVFLPRATTQYVASRTFAQERKEDSSTSNWGTGEPPIDESTTERGVAPGSQESQQLQDKRPSPATDSEGQTPTPNLSRQKSTRDFINSKREERMHAAQGSKPLEEVDSKGAEEQEKILKKGASPADLGSG